LGDSTACLRQRVEKNANNPLTTEDIERAPRMAHGMLEKRAQQMPKP
jgi:hypothetical protein